MKREEDFLTARVRELADRSMQQGIFTFTHFLTPAQIDTCLLLEREIGPRRMFFFGGKEECDRKILRLGDPQELGYEEDFPISCLRIEPTAEKFARQLGHRDYLGALMNLGLDRENLGDIFVREKTAYLFCLSRVSEYIVQELTKVGHNGVRVVPVTETEEELKIRILEENIQAASSRVDSIVAKLYHLSRNTSTELFEAKKVYVNSRLCESTQLRLKEGDVVSVRGYGKFRFEGVSHATKKGKFSYRIGKYS